MSTSTIAEKQRRFKNIPAELLRLDHWVVWRGVVRRSESTKPPYCPATGRLAACDDARSWGTFDEATAACADGRRRFEGVGFVLTEDAGYAVIDLDYCRDPEAGTIEPWALEIIERMSSYSEISPSGRGVHIWCHAKLPPDGRKRGQTEMYDSGRYITITGQHLDGTPLTIDDRQAELTALHRRVFGTDEQPADGKPEEVALPAAGEKPTVDQAAPISISDEELLQKALKSINRRGEALFARLWRGEWQNRYRSLSEASLSLCGLLAFWTAKDAARIDRLFRRSGLYSSKWDRADYRARTISKAISTTREVYTPQPMRTGTEEERRAAGEERYSVSAGGVFSVGPDGKKSWLCSRLDVLAVTRDGRGEDWGRLLRVRDRDGGSHEWAMPMDLLGGDGTELRSRLLFTGLELRPGRYAREDLTNYIQTASPPERARCVPRVGWCGDVFVLPDRTIGSATKERILFQTAKEFCHHFEMAGTLADWRRHVAAYCRGNSRLIFAVSCAFAAPLLEPVGAEGGGFHFRGRSSSGKTTALLVGGSPCGGGGRNGFVETWRATGNALEGVAESHNDCLLCLDELAQLAPAEAGEVAYLLADGHGKRRMSRTAELRPGARWRLLFLSSGEIGLADHVASVGRRARGGEQVRMIEIPSEAEAGLGLFEELHGCADGQVFADRLCAAARTYYGAALRAFLEALLADRDAAIYSVDLDRSTFMGRVIKGAASGEVLRVAAVFGLVAAAGELATEYGITGWEPSEAAAAAEICFDSWLSARGGSDVGDVESGLRQVRGFLEAHGSSRFEGWEPQDRQVTVHNRAGFRRTEAGEVTQYAVLEEVFRADVCRGYDYRLIARALKDRGFLKTSGADRLTFQCRVPKFGRTRVYLIYREILEGNQ